MKDKECFVKDCGMKKDVQYLKVYNKLRPQKEQHREYYCQKHLRLRAAELQFMSFAGDMKTGIR